MRRHITIVIAIVALAAGAGTSPHTLSAQAQSATPRNAVYIVQMDDEPVISYEGGVAGRPGTRPGLRGKIDPESAAVADYARYLDQRHDGAIASIGGARKIYEYRYSFNGFAAELSEAQAAALRTAPGVVSVTEDELQTTVTSHTPSFLGLDEPGGLWSELAGPGRAGEDIIIGVIDSGVWPESLSFTDRETPRGVPSESGRLVYYPRHRWSNRCQEGEKFTEDDCNNKLIGARHFNAAWGGDEGLKAQRPWEFASPRDYNGHGTHTASTAGGNHGVPTTGPAAAFGPISGMAPRARIAVYKALWSLEDGSEANGFTSDLVAAIDRAVADGVDVINYSVSGTQSNFVDPAQIAFLNAAASGIFVSASAGNDGEFFTVAHPSPWVTTVAAGTHNRTGRGAVTLGSATYEGASLATMVTAPVIDAEAAGLPGADATALRLCFTAADNGGTPVLDPAKVADKIVVCDRGTNPRVSKSLAVQQAGGAGMILVNTSPGESVNADFHYVPTVHLPVTDRAAVKAYAETMGPGTIHEARLVFDVPAPQVAAFSSRGPSLAGVGEILKPDLIAPGQDILAAVAPPANGGLSFNMYSGTSMSAPHVAGVAALLMQLHPRWSPMMIKSALMTTGTDVLEGDNTDPTVLFSQGAGHIAPNSAMNPGLVFDSNLRDWLAFLCGSTTSVNPRVCKRLAKRHSFDPSDLNLASISIGDLAGTQTVTRTVKNVSGSSSRYTPTVEGLEGIDVVVEPASLRLRPGESRRFTVTFTRTTADFDFFVSGQLTWSDGDHDVRIPMVVVPVALAAPAEVFGTGAPITYPITFGYTGAFSASARGLVPAATANDSVEDDPDDSFSPDGPGVTSFPVVVPAGTTYARFSLFDAEVSPPSDLDLYVTNSEGTIVAVSGTGTSEEEANLVNPTPGTYTVHVHGFAVQGTATFTLYQWVLGSTAAGNMEVSAPTSATAGATETITLTFSSLTSGTKYLGSVAYDGSVTLPAPTIVRVDP